MVGPVRDNILLIEGYMKADIVHYFTGQTVLAIPGVTLLQHLERTLKDLAGFGVRHVMTCFDMDYLKNWHVESAYSNLIELLGSLPLTFGTYLWSPDHNGRLHLGVLHGKTVSVVKGSDLRKERAA